MKTVAFITLGCKVNTYETEGMKRIFEKAGYEVVEPGNAADVVVINTCTVTHISDKKSRQMIRRARKMNPEAIIAAVGCYAQIAPEEVSTIDGVNLVVGNNHKSEIVELVKLASYDTLKVVVSERKELKEYEEVWVQSFSGQTRAFLKIQDGCDQFCSYCIIPYARGGIRSRSLDSILREARRLSENGFKEIVLTGIHLTSYGKDGSDNSLYDVICGVSRVEGIRRIRLGSLEPLYLSEATIGELSRIRKLCPHFHLSMQSGCDETLSRMNRHYTTKEYREIVGNVRRHFPDAAITTDIMTGFPGESEEEFRQTCDFVKTIGFSQAHIFQYSIRKGTRAATMINQLPSAVKEERSKRLAQISRQFRDYYRNSYIGKVLEVLFEHRQEGLWEGYTENYIPVRVLSEENLTGSILPVTLIENRGDFLFGQIV